MMENFRYTINDLLNEEVSLKNLLIATGTVTIGAIIWKLVRQRRQRD